MSGGVKHTTADPAASLNHHPFAPYLFIWWCVIQAKAIFQKLSCEGHHQLCVVCCALPQHLLLFCCWCWS